MSRNLYAEVDGLLRPLSGLDWVMRLPCGCPFGVASASAYPTEESVWADLYDDHDFADLRRRQGRHLELMTHDRYVSEVSPLLRKPQCPHQPEPAGQMTLPGVSGK